MMHIKLLAAITATALALPALAEIQVTAMDGRIQPATQSGQLTPKETAKLEKVSDKPVAKETKAKTGAPKGTRKVSRTQDKQGKKGNKPKRDAQVGAPTNSR